MHQRYAYSQRKGSSLCPSNNTVHALSDAFLVWTQIRPNTLSYQNITFHLIVKPIHDAHVLSTTCTLSKTMFTIILLIITFTLGYIYANATRNDTSRTSRTLRIITTTSWTITTTARTYTESSRCRNSHTAILVVWIAPFLPRTSVFHTNITLPHHQMSLPTTIARTLSKNSSTLHK